MGRKDSGGDGGGGAQQGGWGSGAKGAKGHSHATQHYGGKGGAQQRGWGQSPPGWPQYPQAQGWGPQDQSWGRPTPYGKGSPGGGKGYQGPYANQEPRGRRGSQGVWQGLQDVTGALRVAFDTAREIRSLGAPAPAPAPGQSQVTDQSGVGSGWLAAARGWLLGGLPDQRPPPPSLLPSPRLPDPATLTTQPCSASSSGLTDRSAKTKTRRAKRWHA